MSNQTILVSGATGTNGHALITALSTKDVTVRALVRDKTAAKGRFPAGVEIVEGNLADPQSLARAFEGIDKAYIVTAVQPNTTELFQSFYDAAKEAGVSQLVKFSGLGASTTSSSEVIRQHGVTDDALITSGVPYTIIRPNSFHQNMLWQADGIAKTDTFYLPLGDAAQSTIDVRDIAEITANILTEEGHIGQIYELTGPESLTFHDVARVIGEVRDKPVIYVPISQNAAEDAMKSAGMPDWSAHALAEIQALFGTGAYADVLPDAERLLGRKPRAFKAFLLDHAAAFAPAAATESAL